MKKMSKAITVRFKLLLALIFVLPALFVAWSYMVPATSAPGLVLAASNAADLTCVSGHHPVAVHQCATWAGTGGGDWTGFIPLILLAVEVGIAVLVFWALKKSERLLLLSKVLLVAAATFLAPVLAGVVNAAAQPYGQQVYVSMSKQKDGIYKVDKQPRLGFGPMDMELFVLFSLPPAVGAVCGAMGLASADQRKYAGMSKEKLFA
jgi:hypothetical protein